MFLRMYLRVIELHCTISNVIYIVAYQNGTAVFGRRSGTSAQIVLLFTFLMYFCFLFLHT